MKKIFLSIALFVSIYGAKSQEKELPIREFCIRVDDDSLSRFYGKYKHIVVYRNGILYNRTISPTLVKSEDKSVEEYYNEQQNSFNSGIQLNVIIKIVNDKIFEILLVNVNNPINQLSLGFPPYVTEQETNFESSSFDRCGYYYFLSRKTDDYGKDYYLIDYFLTEGGYTVLTRGKK